MIPTIILPNVTGDYRIGYAAGANASWGVFYADINISSSAVSMVHAYKGSTNITSNTSLTCYYR